MAVWEVVGGASSGGILVRKGIDTSSEHAANRLSVGSLVLELQLQGERLKYKLLSGEGPPTGWVSLKLKNNNLVVPSEKEPPSTQIWAVVGGASSGGIVVRSDVDTNSSQEAERLSCGATLAEVDLVGDRLQYRRLTGTGPATGWVSLKFKEKDLVVKVDPSASGAKEQKFTTLEITMLNEEKQFSYEGYPAWVPKAAAVQRLWREGKPYLPPPDEPLSRLQGLTPMAPFKKLLPKKLKEMSKQNLPGCMFDLVIPNTAAQLEEYGPEWLTKAFHRAGTMPKDNSVTKILLCKELPTSGFDTAGGAAMKAFLTVEYEKTDPELHTELFVKYPFDFDFRPTRKDLSSSDNDGPEIMVNMQGVHLFPFRSPKFYFGDISRETTNFILISERVPFGKADKMENGRVVEVLKREPFEILPVCGKYQDFLLPKPEEFYYCVFRAMGRLAAWDKLGCYDSLLGENPKYSENDWMARMRIKDRPPQPAAAKQATIQVVGKMMDAGIRFMTSTMRNVAELHPAAKDMEKLKKMKAEMEEMGPYFSDITRAYLSNEWNYLAAMHVNLQVDNAYFWRDEYGDLDCGVLDWGAFQRSPFCMNFIGSLSGADPELMLAHEEKILRCFVDEYARCGGPTLKLEEVLARYRLGYITFVYECNQWLEREVLKETSEEEFATITSILDERFMGRWLTRCRSLTIMNSFAYYNLRGDFKAGFDKWAAGPGKEYLTKYST